MADYKNEFESLMEELWESDLDDSEILPILEYLNTLVTHFLNQARKNLESDDE